MTLGRIGAVIALLVAVVGWARWEFIRDAKAGSVAEKVVTLEEAVLANQEIGAALTALHVSQATADEAQTRLILELCAAKEVTGIRCQKAEISAMLPRVSAPPPPD